MDGKQLEMLFEEQPEGDLEPRTRRPVLRMVARTIRSGNLVEVECYPVYDKAYERQLRKARPTRQAQRIVNDRNSRKKFERLAECNFRAGTDYLMTLTYAGDAPEDDRQLDRDLRNYLSRINRARAKEGLPRARCIGVKERGLKGRLHHHLMISGGLDRDRMEQLWRHGIANCQRIQQAKGGLAGAAKYMSKGFDTKRETGRHRYFYTRNLQLPRITESRHRVSVRQAERIREDTDLYAEQVFRSKYPGLVLESVTAKTTAWMPGVYIYARFRRADHEPS